MSEAREKSSKPPRGPALWKLLTGVMVIAVAMAAGYAWGGYAASAWHRIAQSFAKTEAKSEEGAGHQYYTCGMHPWVVLPEPGDCPICGMKLVPLDATKFTGEVAIDPVVVQNIGVRVEEVTRGPVVRTLRTVGNVDYDETRLYDVNVKTGGWIEKLYVDTLGQVVSKGDKLFDLYSPQLYAAQDEYLSAVKNRKIAGGEDLLAAARGRLKFFDVSDEQIAELEKRGTAGKLISFTSPADGVVTAKQAVEGMKVNAGMQVYRIADLSKVWVMATLYEDQLPFARAGQEAEMTPAYGAGEKFSGKVIYVYPYVDQKTRQIMVRLAFDNPGGLLKPGMFATVTIRSELAEDRVLAPRSAVVDTGERKVAFVSLGDGKFEPRKVRTGARTEDDRVEILEGLKAGEMVVTSGQFLIDSEAKMREALAKMIGGSAEKTADKEREAAPGSGLEAGVCPVTGNKLGSMGPVVKVAYQGRTVELCCSMCVAKFNADPRKYLQKLDEGKTGAESKNGEREAASGGEAE